MPNKNEKTETLFSDFSDEPKKEETVDKNEINTTGSIGSSNTPTSKVEVKGGKKNKLITPNEDFLKNSSDDVFLNEVNSTTTPTNTKQVEHSPITVSNDVITGFNEFDEKCEALIQQAVKIISISDDFENEQARVVGKELTDLSKDINKFKLAKNKPLNEQIDLNNDTAKKIIAPINIQIDRLKNAVNKYEMDKESKRQAEIQRLANEKKQREEAEQKEIQRKQNIRNQVEKIKNSVRDELAKDSLESIKPFLVKLKGFAPKEDFFMEYYNEVLELKESLIKDIESKIPILETIAEQKAKAAELDGIAKQNANKEAELAQKELDNAKKQKENEALQKQVQEESDELSATQELITMTAALSIEKPMDYIDTLKSKYGSAREAVKNKGAIVTDYQKNKRENEQKAALDADKVKNQRLDFKFEILDENAIPREYLCVDETKIRKAITANRKDLEKDINSFKIEGILITSETKTIFKN
jgi:hypothetical protein